MSEVTHTAAIAGALVWMPWDIFTDAHFADVCQRATARVSDYRTQQVREIFGFEIDEERGWIGLPVTMGMRLARDWTLPIREFFSDGHPLPEFSKRPDPTHPSAPADQARLFDEIVEHTKRHPATLVKAPTGSGKTVMALNAIAELRKTALVIVDTRMLALQWAGRIKEHLGLTDDDIGFIRDGKADYDGKKITIAVMANLTRKTWPKALYQYFGIVIWDEAHILGAEGFSQTTKLFPARHRLALTATPDRKDNAECLFLNYFGDPAVEATSDAIFGIVRVINRLSSVPRWASEPQQIIRCLVKQRSRNEDLALIFNAFHERNRNALILSDSIEQLHELMGICRWTHGIEERKLGLYARQRIVSGNGKKRQAVKDSELEEVADRAQLIFATYGMAKKGLDIPRLDAGLDASPRADGVQAAGRIRRPYPNKLTPEWVTIRDVGIKVLERYTESRLRDYASANMRIIDAPY